jgi:hypothetical protein
MSQIEFLLPEAAFRHCVEIKKTARAETSQKMAKVQALALAVEGEGPRFNRMGLCDRRASY